MQILSNTLAFLFCLGIIIFVHELGHLLVAKAFGVRVRVFSLGFGKRLWGFRRGETDYMVSAIPLGGYVKLGGEDPQEITGDPKDFLLRPRWQRVLVYLAGPTMNVLLAIVLVALVFMVGIEVAALQDNPAVVGTVEEGSPAERAGLRSGDLILKVDGRPVERWQEVAFALMTSPERPVTLTLSRGREELSATVIPERIPSYEFGDAGVYPKILPRIAGVVEGSPAAAAGFKIGDLVRSVDERPLSSPSNFADYIQEHPGQEIRVEVERESQPVVLHVTPQEREGKIRIGVVLTISKRYPPLRALGESVRYNFEIVRQTFVVLGKIFTREMAARGALSGPIEIAAWSGAAARSGFRNLLYLMGVISISVAVLNLLPIPILDGGHIFLLLVEGTLRRDLSLRLKERINQVGLVVIVMLMVMVLYFDLVKNLPAGLVSDGKDQSRPVSEP